MNTPPKLAPLITALLSQNIGRLYTLVLAAECRSFFFIIVKEKNVFKMRKID